MVLGEPLPGPAPGPRDPAAGHARALLWLAAGNAAAAVVHGAGYQAAVLAGPGQRAYLALALAGQLAAAFALAAALLLPLARLRAGRAVLYLAAPVLAAAVHAFLYVDRKLFAIMGMHVNRLALDLVLSPGGLDALDVPAEEWRALGLGAAALLAAEAAAYAWMARRATRPRAPGRGGWLRLAAALVVLLGAERVVYAGAVVAGAPLADAAAAAPAFGLERLFRLRQAGVEPLRYPRGPVAVDAAAPRPNLLWIVVESWRRDALDPALTPEIWRVAQGGLAFRNHVSGGNASVVGVFSQFYGLHGNSIPALVRARQGPVLFQVLRDRGYRVHVVAANSVDYAGMRAAVFAGVDDVWDDAGGGTPAEHDLAVARRARALVEAAPPGQPFALVVFFDGTHVPYAFDPAAARHRPYAEALRLTDLDRVSDSEGLRNRYRNAVAAVDRAAGEVLGALEARGLAETTITVVAGDHGEALGEHGRVGHQVSLSPEETATPLVLRGPGIPVGERTGLSRHVDLAPTVLGLLGVTTPASEYSVGASLLTGPAPELAVLVGPMHRGVRFADGWTVEWETGDEALDARSGYRVRDPAYRVVEGDRSRVGPGVAKAVAELRAFSR